MVGSAIGKYLFITGNGKWDVVGQQEEEDRLITGGCERQSQIIQIEKVLMSYMGVE